MTSHHYEIQKDEAPAADAESVCACDGACRSADASGSSLNEGANIDEVIAKERDEYLLGWRRAKADYENLKKEMTLANESCRAHAREDLLFRLLPVFDHLESALAHAPSTEGVPEDLRKPFERWIAGIEAVRAFWMKMAKDFGLEKIPIDIPFNPEFHDAVGEEEAAEVPEGVIVRATADGWTLNGKAIRPARVIISSNQKIQL